MNWSELIDRVATRSGVSKATARRVLTAAVDETLEAVQSDQGVTWWRVGTFTRRLRKARTQRSIASGRRMFVGDAWLPRFRPAQALREAVTEREAVWRDAEYQRAWRLAETILGDLALYQQGATPAVSADQTSDEVDAACRATYGGAWSQAQSTFRSRTPEALHHLLEQTAQRRWSP